MTDPIDTARQEGIALGLAMAKAAPRYDIYTDAMASIPDAISLWLEEYWG